MNVDIARAFRGVFKDPDWVKKTLLGWVWVVLLVTLPAVIGAGLEYIVRVARGDERLPDWNDFGEKWVKGLLVIVAGALYFLPIIILAFIFVVPWALSNVQTTGQVDFNAFSGLLAGSMCLFWVLAVAWGIAVSILFYAAMVNFAVKGNFGSLFEIGEIWAKVRAPGSGYFVTWLFALLISILGSAVNSILGGIVIGFILLPAVPYLQMMLTSHLFGQWAGTAYAMTPAYAPPAQPPAPTYTAAQPGAPTYPQPTYPPPTYPPPGYPPPPAPPAPPAPAAPTVQPPQAPPSPATPSVPPPTPPGEAPAPTVAPEAPAAPQAPSTPQPPAAPGESEEPPSS